MRRSGRCAAACSTSRRCSRRSPHSSPTRSLNLAWGETEALGDAPDSVHLLDFPEPDEGLEDADLELGMAAVRRAVELGRAARAQAGVKVRQPLRKAVIVATDRERDEIQRLSELVARELNVKEIEFVAEEAELVRYEVKPNYRSLGPRFGKLMPQAAAAVEALDPTAVAEAVAGERTIGIQVNGTEHDIEPDDVSLVLRPLDGYQVEAESGRAVALALDLDDELRREGSRERWCTPSRTPAGTRGWRSPTGSSCGLAATRNCWTPRVHTRTT